MIVSIPGCWKFHSLTKILSMKSSRSRDENLVPQSGAQQTAMTKKKPYEFMSFFLARDDFELQLLAKQRWDMQKKKLWFSVMLVIKSIVRRKLSRGCFGKRF